MSRQWRCKKNLAAIRLQRMGEQTIEADVVVVGGGNAALCAALVARESGVSVTVLESAPVEYRGGNSRHTRNMRCMHETPTNVLTDAYSEEEYFSDLLRVTEGNTAQDLARLVIRDSPQATQWMKSYGVRFQPSLEGTLHLSRTNAFFLGGGKALMNAYYAAAIQRGIRVLYNAEVTELHIRDGQFKSGRLLMGQGAESVGDPKQCHAVAVDARAPKFDGGIVTRLDCLPLGIVVNKRAERFYDEGQDLWPKRYAIWGRLVAEQADQIAWSIIDSKVMGRFMPSVFPPIPAASIGELASALGLLP